MIDFSLRLKTTLLDVAEETPLLNAAQNGLDEIGAYLLQFRKVLTDLKEQEDEVDNARVS